MQLYTFKKHGEVVHDALNLLHPNILILVLIQVHTADKILELLNLGNSRRKTESTEANVTSSR